MSGNQLLNVQAEHCSPNAPSNNQKTIPSQGSPFAMDETSTSSPSSVHSKVVPAHDLATLSRKKTKRASIRIHLRHTPSWLYRALFYVLAYHFLLSAYRSVRPQLGRVLPTVITRVVIQSDVRCDYRSVFSHIIPFGHDFASAQTGAVLAPRLTTPGVESNPLSEISRNPAGACWSFRGNSGTFGVVLNAPNVLPSHVVIQHQPSNSTALLSRAPRQVVVWGLVDGAKNAEAYKRRLRDALASTSLKRPPLSMSREGLFLPLAEFVFDITAPSMHQIFPLFDEARSWGIDFGVIVFQVLSNWGADVTSLCSVHVYGCMVLPDKQI